MDRLQSMISAIASAVAFRMVQSLSRQIEVSRHSQDAEFQEGESQVREVSGLEAFLQRITGGSSSGAKTFAQRIPPDRLWQLEHSETSMGALRAAHEQAVQLHRDAVDQGEPDEKIADCENSIVEAANKLKEAAAAHEQLLLNAAAPDDRVRLNQSALTATNVIAARDDIAAKQSAAVAELDAEQKSPTGKDQAKLSSALIDFEEALKQASLEVERTTEAHEKLKNSISNKTRATRHARRQEPYSVQTLQPNTLWNVLRPFQSARRGIGKARQSIRVAQQRISRFKKSWMQSSVGKRQLQVARRTHPSVRKKHHSRRRTFRDAMRSFDGIATGRTSPETMTSRNHVDKAAKDFIQAGVEAASTRGTVSEAVDNRDSEAVGQRNQGPVRDGSTFSDQLFGVMAQHNFRDRNTRQATLRPTSDPSEGLVRSTLALQQATQPRHAASDDLSNRFPTVSNRVARVIEEILNRLTFMTPIAEAVVGLLERIVGITEGDVNLRKKQEMSNGVHALWVAWDTNKKTRHTKSLPPVPKVK